MLAWAKMNMLIRRGLVHGCPCGCRGDYELTVKGCDFIKKPPHLLLRGGAELMAAFMAEHIARKFPSV
jgi:hypothetical protein